MVYFKNLSRKATFNKVLRDKAFNIAQNLKYDGCKCGLFINTFGKKKSGANISGYVKPKIRITQKYTLLYKQYLSSWSFFSKYAWVVPLKDKNDIIITNTSPKSKIRS